MHVLLEWRKKCNPNRATGTPLRPLTVAANGRSGNRLAPISPTLDTPAIINLPTYQSGTSRTVTFNPALNSPRSGPKAFSSKILRKTRGEGGDPIHQQKRRDQTGVLLRVIGLTQISEEPSAGAAHRRRGCVKTRRIRSYC